MTFATVLFSRAEMIRSRTSDADDREVDLDLDFAFDINNPSLVLGRGRDDYRRPAMHCRTPRAGACVAL